MTHKNVIIVLICHNMDIVNDILKDDKKQNFHIMFVGNQEITINDPRITIVRNLPNNIEYEKDLLTFTAWYAIVKNNLFLEYDYICILEYDITIEDNFENNLIQCCQTNTYDIISFIHANDNFMIDIKENIATFFLKQKGLVFKKQDSWFSTTNQCLKRKCLIDFVDWYYPDCLYIKKLDPIQVSWYHERIFNVFINERSYHIYHLNGLKHFVSNSHNYMHRQEEVSEVLVDFYMNNPNCEFLNKLLNNYSFFLKLNIDFCINVGSYLCPGHSYSYTPGIYEKQKLLFETAKKSKNVLLIGNYMGHIAFIMLMANPNINITCIDTQSNYKYNPLLEKYFQKTIFSYISNDQEHVKSILSNNMVHSYDFIHISQQYPVREYLNDYIDICIKKSRLQNITFMLDDYNVYSNEIIEDIKNNNIHCKISNEIIANGTNTTKKFNVSIYKKYLLIYDDDTEQFKNHIDKLINSVKEYDDDFIIRVFHKKDIDSNFVNENKYILDQYRGGGYWLWKPYIINKTLTEINENDILFYIDSRYYFIEKFNKLYKNILNNDLLVWRNKPNEPSYYLKNWCKMDIIHKYNIYDDVFKHDMEACWAGALIIRSTRNAKNIISEWLKMCCSNDITDEPSKITNSSEFCDHRHDQSLLSIVVSKYKIPLYTFEKRFIQNVRIPY